MEEKESLIHYYESTSRALPADLLNSKGATSHFNVLKRNNCLAALPFGRKDYYKICLTTGHAVLYTDKGELEITQPTIFFSNPGLKFGWKNLSREQGGYVCLFNEQHISLELKRELRTLYRLFDGHIYPFLYLDDAQYAIFLHYFELMFAEYHGDFVYKNELIQSALKLIVYTSVKIQTTLCPTEKITVQHSLVSRFLDLLNGQFPVDSPKTSLPFKSPADFASQLNVHVNHLNHCVKNDIGKSTSHVIADRILAEAIDLLKGTDWTIAEIGNSLGFEYPQHFNSFFKKQTGKSPGNYKVVV